MNIRVPNDPQLMPAAAQSFPDRVRRVRPRTWLILGIAAVVVVGFILWRTLGGPAAPVRPVPPVQVTRITRQDLSIVEHTIGTVVANATVQLSARVQGQLLKADFKEGDVVRAGQLLFQLDPRPYQAVYDSAAATLASAKAKADRYARLMTAHAVAPQDADDARAAYQQALAAVQTARLNLEYTQIRSPIDGKTGPILIQPGNQVMAGAGSSGGTAADAAPASTLVVITQIQPVKISLSLPQADLPRIQQRALNNALTAAIDNHVAGAAPILVTIDFVGNAVNNATGTIELRATFANADLQLVPGQLVDVAVTLDALKNVMVVPREAVNLGPGSRYVYVVKDGKAEMIEVKVLSDDGTNDAIEGKIKPGDAVIVDGQLRVLPGKPVRIVKPGAASTPAAP